MLLKRLDVTVESFLWSAKAQGREAEIKGAIAGRRRALAPTPASIHPEDAFAGACGVRSAERSEFVARDAVGARVLGCKETAAYVH